MTDPRVQKAAKELVELAGVPMHHIFVGRIMNGIPKNLRTQVIREFHHEWRNTLPSEREKLDDVRATLRETYVAEWQEALPGVF